MKTSPPRPFNFVGAGNTPAMLWWQTWFKAAETMVAAPQVIAQRTARMAQAGPAPNAIDQRELLMMGVEKAIAFSQAWMNSTAEIMAFQQQAVNAALRLGWGMASASNPMAAVSSPLAWMRASVDLLSGSQRALTIMPRVAHGAVKPIHAKATSNARRLARRKR